MARRILQQQTGDWDTHPHSTLPTSVSVVVVVVGPGKNSIPMVVLVPMVVVLVLAATTHPHRAALGRVERQTHPSVEGAGAHQVLQLGAVGVAGVAVLVETRIIKQLLVDWVSQCHSFLWTYAVAVVVDITQAVPLELPHMAVVGPGRAYWESTGCPIPVVEEPVTRFCAGVRAMVGRG